MLERNWYNCRDGRGGRLRKPIGYETCPIWGVDPSLAERMSTEEICEMYWCARCVLLEDEDFWRGLEESCAEGEQGRRAEEAWDLGGGCPF